MLLPSLLFLTNPTVGESFSYSALESLSIGLPILSRITGAITDLVDNNVSGFTCSSPSELAANASSVASSFHRYKSFSNMAFKKYSHSYRLSDTSQSLISLIEQFYDDSI